MVRITAKKSAGTGTDTTGKETDMLEAYIDYKRANELDPVRLRPTPYEFMLYFDI